MKLNKNINLLIGSHVGFILIATGIYFWAYWSGWYDSNLNCTKNWHFQTETIRSLNQELFKEFENYPSKSALLKEAFKTSNKNISGYLSGINPCNRKRSMGLCFCIIGLFIVLWTIASYFIRVPKKASIHIGYRPIFVAISSTLFIYFTIWVSYTHYQKHRIIKESQQALLQRIVLHYFCLLRLQKMGAQFAPALIVENLRSDVGMYLFRKKEGLMPENETCEVAKKWLLCHDIGIPIIEKDTNGGMQKSWTPVGNKPIKIGTNSNEDTALDKNSALRKSGK